MLRNGLFALALLVSAPCFAQSNVGDIIKLGATKMSKEDLQNLHAGGVTMKGFLGNGTPFSQLNKADGSVSGTGGNNGQFTLTGNWKIDDSGKYCHYVSASGGITTNLCSIIWKADNRYFASVDDVPTTVVRERQFVK